MQSSQEKFLWEQAIAKGYTVSDLDHEEILRTYRLGVAQKRLPETASINIQDILERFELIEKGFLLNAAVVLYGKKMTSNYIQCEMRLARFKGTNKTSFLDQKQVRGNAFVLLEESMLFLQRHLPVAGKILPDKVSGKQTHLYKGSKFFCAREYGKGFYRFLTQ